VFNALLKRLISMLRLLAVGWSAFWAIPNPKMSMSNTILTRQMLNELLQQTPSIPTTVEKQTV
jgi:hypothetical protein